jgi:hypothetical protein
MRRILCLCAASSLLALGLAACGSDSEEDPTTAAASSAEESTEDDTAGEDDASSASDDESASEEPADEESSGQESSGQESSDDGSADDASDTPSDDDSDDASDSPSSSDDASEGSGDDSDEGSDDGPGSTGQGATAISDLWPDDTWTIEDLDEDLCEMGGKTRSPFASDDDMFVCGPTAAGVEACDMTEGSEVLCITDPLEHTAVRFGSPTAQSQDDMHQGDGDLLPLFVTLDDGSADGVTCATISHDHDRHWHDKLSWYRCDDGSELLTDELIEETFDRSDDTWTVQRSVDKKKPATVSVMDAVFAGNG